MEVCVDYDFMNDFTTVFRYDPLKRDVILPDFGYFPWLTRFTCMSGI